MSTTDLASTACHPGQSYNPEADDHADLILIAAAREMKRNGVTEKQSKPLSQGLSEDTLKLLMGDVSSRSDHL